MKAASLSWWIAATIALGAAACTRAASQLPRAASGSPAAEPVRRGTPTPNIEMETGAPTPPPRPQRANVASLPELGRVDGCSRSAIVVLIDRSQSMVGEPIGQARAALWQIVRSLGPEDCLGVIAFNTVPARLLRLTRVTNRSLADSAFSNLSPAGGTVLESALEVAFRDVRAATGAPRRGVIVLTDGRVPHGGLRDLVDLYTEDGVEFAVFALGVGTDASLARMLSDAGHGRSYAVHDATALRHAIAAEIARLTL